ncbi:MAG: serine--tRNA ligase, partial [Pseudomonadales bacterium]
MLDPGLLRSDPEGVAEKLRKKHFVLDVARLRALEAERKQLQVQTETLQSERRARSRKIGQAKAKGADIESLVKKPQPRWRWEWWFRWRATNRVDLGEQLDQAKQALTKLQGELKELQLAIPNLPDDSVPEGVDEADNTEIRHWRRPTQFNFEPKDHVDLGAQGSLDFEAAARIAGSRFVVIRGHLASLHRALTQ